VQGCQAQFCNEQINEQGILVINRIGNVMLTYCFAQLNQCAHFSTIAELLQNK